MVENNQQVALKRQSALALINSCKKAGPDDYMLKRDVYELAKHFGKLVVDSNKASAKKIAQLEAKVLRLEGISKDEEIEDLKAQLLESQRPQTATPRG